MNFENIENIRIKRSSFYIAEYMFYTYCYLVFVEKTEKKPNMKETCINFSKLDAT